MRADVPEQQPRGLAVDRMSVYGGSLERESAFLVSIPTRCVTLSTMCAPQTRVDRSMSAERADFLSVMACCIFGTFISLDKVFET